jgi:hypothetical protein
VDALGGRENVTERSENARFTRSDRTESRADALSSSAFALVARNDAPCASDMRVRSRVMPHSSPAGRVRLMKEATFTQEEHDSSTFERVSSSKKAARSRSRRVVTLKLPRPVPALIKYGRAMVTAMTNNPNFTNPDPALASVTAALDELQVAETATQARTHGAAATRNDNAVDGRPAPRAGEGLHPEDGRREHGERRGHHPERRREREEACGAGASDLRGEAGPGVGFRQARGQVGGAPRFVRAG